MLNDKKKLSLTILVIFLFGVYCFVFGQSGILERMNLQKQTGRIDREIEEFEAKNDLLFELMLKYRSGKNFETEAKKYGYLREGEHVIIMPSVNDENKEIEPSFVPQSATQDIIESETAQLRLLWIILSFVIIFLYIIKTRALFKKGTTVEGD